jgi:bla regulator protein blaR1
MIPSVFYPLANHLWQSTLFAAVAGCLTLGLRRNRAHTRYWLWLTASVKFLIPFSLLVDVGGHFERHSVPALSTRAISYVIEQASAPFAITVPPAAMSEAPASSPANWIPAILCTVWAIGFTAFVFSWSVKWGRLRAALQRASPLDPGIEIKNIEVRTSAAFAEPGVFGIRQPVLLLPAGITDCLTRPQLEAIVAHELCHVRRRDNLTSAIHMGVEALFWFHPLVWWLGARLMEERERACDEAVLLMGSEPTAYAEGILRICELYLESPLPCVAGVTGAGATRTNLKTRIEEIMLKRIGVKLSFGRKIALLAAGVAVVVLPVAVGILNAPAILAQSQKSGPSRPVAKFEVTSIRPCNDGLGRSDTKKGPPGGAPIISSESLNTGCAALAAHYPMAGLIQRAYGRLGLGRVVAPGSALPIEGGPAWIYNEDYIIRAKASEQASKEAMEGPMLQALLEDRFQLKTHRETREVPVYTLSAAKGGLKLQTAAEGSCVPTDYSVFPRPRVPEGKRRCNDLIGRKGANTTLNVDDATVEYFSKLLSIALDRPIIVKSGIPGKYNFHLEFATDQTAFGGVKGLPVMPADEPAAASVFTAVQEQLGLKLEAAKGPREFLVVDHVERPSAN